MSKVLFQSESGLVELHDGGEGRAVVFFSTEAGDEALTAEDVQDLSRALGAHLGIRHESTSPEVAALAARGLADPSSLSLEEIQRVCGSAATQKERPDTGWGEPQKESSIRAGVVDPRDRSGRL